MVRGDRRNRGPRETLPLAPAIQTDAPDFAEFVLAGTVAHSPVERTHRLQAAVEMYGDSVLAAHDLPWVTEHREQLEPCRGLRG